MMLDGLVIRAPWIDRILDGSKTWEIRGNRTTKRGQIALIKSGTGCVFGIADLVDVIGPLTVAELTSNAGKAGLAPFDITGLPYRRTFAWVLRAARRLRKPVSYSHPAGAVIWVNLPNSVKSAVFEQVGDAAGTAH